MIAQSIPRIPYPGEASPINGDKEIKKEEVSTSFALQTQSWYDVRTRYYVKVEARESATFLG